MGRRTAIRTSYNSDAQFMLRLADAVSRDDKRPPNWRSEVVDSLKSLANKLLSAPDVKGK